MNNSAQRADTEHMLTFERVDGPFGVIVRGVDWDRPARDEVHLLTQAWRRHLLLVFRGQPSPTHEQLDRFFERFGHLLLDTVDGNFHYETFSRDKKEEIHRRNDGNYFVSTERGTSELIWHQDQFHRPQLKKMSVLEAIEFEPGAAATYFRDVYTALELLPRELRFRLEDRQSINFDPRLPPPDQLRRLCDAMHLVLTAHPDSGRRALCVTDYTSRIAGLSQTESDQLIAELRAFIDRHAPFYAHHWQSGDIVAWDNIGLQHRRPSSGPEYKRVMRIYEGIAE